MRLRELSLQYSKRATSEESTRWEFINAEEWPGDGQSN